MSPVVVPGPAGLAALLVLVALCGLVVRLVVGGDGPRSADRLLNDLRRQIDELETARAILVRRIAERDHEMSNLVVGLSGASHLLDDGAPSVGAAERKAFRTAFDAELTRLVTLLHHPLDAEPVGAIADRADVRSVLTDVVALRRLRGPIDVRIDGNPEAGCPPSVLLQALTNLLTNCERHAAGAAVHVRASVEEDRVRIRVQDEGPGLAGGVGPGSSRTDGDGRGLGLRLVTESLAGCGGTVQLRPGRELGCEAVLDLPRWDCGRIVAGRTA